MVTSLLEGNHGGFILFKNSSQRLAFKLQYGILMRECKNNLL